MFGTRVRSDLKLPSPLPTLLSTYLLLAIGLKGGAAMAKADAGDLALPAIATIAIGCMIPAVTFFVLRRIARMPINASAAMAAFTARSRPSPSLAMTFMERGGYKGRRLPALTPYNPGDRGDHVALLLVARYGANMKLGPALHEVLTGRSILMLAAARFSRRRQRTGALSASRSRVPGRGRRAGRRRTRYRRTDAPSPRGPAARTRLRSHASCVPDVRSATPPPRAIRRA